MIGRPVVLLAIALIGSTYSEAGKAFGRYCTRPAPPYCIDAFGTFDDEWSFRRCKSDVELYTSEVDSYVECLVDEVEREISNARSEASETVDRFNCRAEQRGFCP